MWAVSADDGDDLMDEDSLLSAEDLKPKVKVAEDPSDCATARTPRTLNFPLHPFVTTFFDLMTLLRILRGFARARVFPERP